MQLLDTITLNLRSLHPDGGDEGDGPVDGPTWDGAQAALHPSVLRGTLHSFYTDFLLMSSKEGREHESYCLMLGTWRRFSFAQARHLNMFWAALNREEVGGRQSSFQIWRTHMAGWEDATVNTTIFVLPWERRMIIRRTGLGAIPGFMQVVIIPQMGHQAPEVVPLAQPAGPYSPTVLTLEPLMDDEEQPTSNVDGEAAERAWQHTPPLPPLLPPPPPPPPAGQPSPAPSAASLVAIEDPSPFVPSAGRDRLTTPNTSPTSSLFQLTLPPSSQHGLTSSPPGNLDDPEIIPGLPEAGPSNEALAALWDSPGAVIIPLFPETPVVRRKQRRIIRAAQEDCLVYPPSPINLTNDCL